MAYRYNDDSGDFEEVKSVTERIGKFCRCVLRGIFRVVCWFAAVGLVGGGVVAVWKHRTEIGEKFSAVGSHLSWIRARCAEVWDSCAAWLDGLDLTLVRRLGGWMGENVGFVLFGLVGALGWKFRKLIWQVARRPLGVVFYPAVKWWEMERDAWRDDNWLLAVVWLFPGLMLVAVYRAAFAFLVGVGTSLPSAARFDHAGFDAFAWLGVVVGFGAYVIFYVKALSLAKTGELTVYRDWGDFIKSAIWVVAAPWGIALGSDTGSDWLVRIAGWVMVVLGAQSLWWLVSGAFKYNRGSKRWLALFARFAVLLLLVFALAKLNEKFQQYKRHQLGVVRGVLIPLVVFSAVFNWLIRPMIGDRSRW